VILDRLSVAPASVLYRSLTPLLNVPSLGDRANEHAVLKPSRKHSLHDRRGGLFTDFEGDHLAQRAEIGVLSNHFERSLLEVVQSTIAYDTVCAPQEDRGRAATWFRNRSSLLHGANDFVNSPFAIEQFGGRVSGDPKRRPLPPRDGAQVNTVQRRASRPKKTSTSARSSPIRLER